MLNFIKCNTRMRGQQAFSVDIAVSVPTIFLLPFSVIYFLCIALFGDVLRL